MTNLQKNFRKQYEAEKYSYKRPDIIRKFVNGELAITIPSQKNFFSKFFSKFKPKEKSHTEIVISELSRFVKRYHNFDFFNILQAHYKSNPELYSSNDLQEIFNIYIGELYYTDKHLEHQEKKKSLEDILEIAYMFDTIMTEENFKIIYSFISSHAKPYIEKCEILKDNPEQYDDQKRYYLYPWINKILFFINSACNKEQNSKEKIFDIVGENLYKYFKYNYFFEINPNEFASIQIFLNDPNIYSKLYFQKYMTDEMREKIFKKIKELRAKAQNPLEHEGIEIIND